MTSGFRSGHVNLRYVSLMSERIGEQARTFANDYDGSLLRSHGPGRITAAPGATGLSKGNAPRVWSVTSSHANIQGLLIAANHKLKRFLVSTGRGRHHAPCGSFVALPGEPGRLSAGYG